MTKRLAGFYWVRIGEMWSPAEQKSDGMWVLLGRAKPLSEKNLNEIGPPILRAIKGGKQ